MEKNSFSTIKVALLIKDIKSIEKISKSLRNIGIFPYFFREVLEFFDLPLDEWPDLLIIDVSMINKDFTNHPRIISNSLPLAFFHSKDDQNKLKHVENIFNYGQLKKMEDYEWELKDIITRVIKFSKLSNDLKYKITPIHHFLPLDKAKNLEDFFLKLANILENLQEVTLFSLATLDQEGLRIVSPPIPTSKYKPIKTIKLKKNQERGIDFWAQNIILEEILNILGDNLTVIGLNSHFKSPDYILFLKQEGSFDQKILERVISSFYTKLLLSLEKQNSFEVLEPLNIQPWKLMSLISEEGWEKDNQVIDVNLTPLVIYIKDHPLNPFHFEEFMKDFVDKFYLDHDYNYRISHMGIYHLAYIIRRKDKEMFLHSLSLFIKNFPIEKYFKDEIIDNLQITSIRPRLNHGFSSFVEYLQLLDS